MFLIYSLEIFIKSYADKAPLTGNEPWINPKSKANSQIINNKFMKRKYLYARYAYDFDYRRDPYCCDCDHDRYQSLN